ncbi:MAG TPA: ABC transporter ATP-binding protein [Gemmatimonadales bacterium]|nr:ABC transporter ATP-binding protein [Gemmatimonadales bacterium]
MRELRTVLPYLRRYRRAYAAGLVLVIISNFFTTLGPRYLQQGIDALAAAAPLAAVRHAALLLLGVAVLGGVARFGMRQLLNSGSRRVETDLRAALFRHLERLSPAFYDRYAVGDLMARSTNDLLAVRLVAGPGTMYLVDTVTRALLIGPAMVAISPGLTGLALLPLVGLPVVMTVLGGRIHRRSEAIQAQFSELTTHVHENLSGARIVRAYRQEAAETARFGSLSAEYGRRNVALARAQGLFHPLLALLGGLGTAIVLGYGGTLVLRGRISVGAFVAFGVYLAMLLWPMIAFGWVINLLQRGEASMGRVNQLFREAAAVPPPLRPVPLPPASRGRRLAFEDVWFRYPAALDRGWVLRGITFAVDPGRSLAVVGPTGAGKSALVELVGRAYDPDRGRITIDGVDLRDLSPGDLRAAVGFVPQETFLFNDTLRENLLLGAPDDGRVERAVAVAQLTETVAELPHRLDTVIGERGVTLSGGQKQRAAIARALVQDPPVFVLDDALSAVDTRTEAAILAGLRDALAGRTSVVVSHRLAAVRDADEILVLDGGEVVERGANAELLAREGRYWQLLRRQQLEEELEGVGGEGGRQ